MGRKNKRAIGNVEQIRVSVEMRKAEKNFRKWQRERGHLPAVQNGKAVMIDHNY
ncbi:MAG: hypothetical protein K6U74_01105 [Firmicutes bacterium]|nr:hypothetical protein [Bacillota bacterium]